MSYRDEIGSAPTNDRNHVGASPVYDDVHRAPGERRCGYYRTEDLDRNVGWMSWAKLKESVLKTHGRDDIPGIDTTAGAVGEPNAGAVLRAAMAVTMFGSGGDAPGDVDNDITLTLLSQRPMVFQDFEVEMQDRVGALETAVDDAVDHGLPPECAKMLRDVVFRTHFDVLRRALLGDALARVEPMTVRFYPGARVVGARRVILRQPRRHGSTRTLLT